ncbi:MAG: putative arabinose efflux permease, family [Betaproteobacteria bacterium]|nr:putative arabinose efflux permease, family [Betaproteobacteria bacterium]
MFERLFWLSLGAFAVGTEGLVIAGILPGMSRDLNVSLAAIGQLVTVFSLAYALGSPLLAIATAAWPREHVLRAAMGGFAAANLLAALAPGYWWLMAARVLLALAAGLFMPTAGAYAAASVEPAQRGRAIGFVYMGMTVALVVGVPLGTWIGGALGWRATFVGVAVLALPALAGLCLPRPRQVMQAPAGLRERLGVAARPEILRSLGVTFFWVGGAFAIFTYLAPFMHAAVGMGEASVAWVLMLWGVGAAAGNLLGGHLADSKGPRYVIVRALAIMMAVFALLSLAAAWLAPPLATAVILVLIAAWGVAGWAFAPAQQSYLVHLAPPLAPVALSLNSSAMYLGISLGAFVSSFAVAWGQVTVIGWIGCGAEVAALGLVWLGARRRPAQPAHPAAA